MSEPDGLPEFAFDDREVRQLRREAKRQLFELIDQIRRAHPDLDSDEILAELESIDHRG